MWKPKATSDTPRRLTLDGVSKRFRDTVALHRIDLDVQPGELVALLGPSGCGKTTTLRLIAGFEYPDEGAVRIDGEDVSHLPPNKRGLGMVFQNYSLFPHLTVAENIGFGLKMANAPKSRIAAEIQRMLELIRLDEHGGRRISQLSGGQQQRVALARAIVTHPSVLLLDEPLGALDKNLREGMQLEIRRLQQDMGITSVMVTHDQEEAMTMSDRIVVMSQGRILQIGAPDEVYNHPRNRFVAEFLGTANILACRVLGLDDAHMDLAVLRQDANPAAMESGAAGLGAAGSGAAGHRLRIAPENAPAGLQPGSIVHIAVRPEKIRIGSAAADGCLCLQGAVLEHVFRGAQHSYLVQVPDLNLCVAVTQPADSRGAPVHRKGDALTLSFHCDAAVPLHEDEASSCGHAEAAGQDARKAA